MRRIPELDAVRGIAAVAIVLFHWRFHVPFLRTAVDLFFVLSGYLITAILLETLGAKHAFRTFYARRALRIFPIYYLTFAVFLAVNRLSPRPHRIDALPYFLTYTQYIQGYWRSTIPPFSKAFGHTWTLAIEEQFYLFWPLAVRMLGRRGLTVMALPLVALAVALRVAGLDPHMLLTRWDGLVLGALLAAILADGERVRRHRSRFGLAFVLIALASAVPIGGSRLADGLFYSQVALLDAGLVGLIVLYAGHAALRPLRARWLCGVGQVSYGLYMYHIPVFVLVTEAHNRLGFRHPMRADLVKLTATFAVAGLSWRFVERPILALKDRWAYRPPDATGAIPAPTGVSDTPGRRRRAAHRVDRALPPFQIHPS